MGDLIEIVKSLEDTGLLLKGVTESVQNEVKKKKRRISQYVIICYITLAASLLGNLLTGKGVNKKGKGIHRAGEGTVRAGEGINMDF